MIFSPSKKQWAAWEKLNDLTTRWIGYGGSAYSGKSFLMAHWLTINCLQFPKTSWGLGRNELTTLRKTTLVTLFQVLESYKITVKHGVKFNHITNTLEFDNGSIIYLLDMSYKPSDPLYTRFGGLELTGCAIDESAEVDIKAIHTLYSRCGRRLNHKYGIAPKCLECFNPAKNHVYTRFYKPYVDNNLPDDTVFIKALPHDNPSPDVDSYLSNILATGDDTLIQRLINGNFEYDDDIRALCDYNSISKIFTNSYVRGNGKKYITADIAMMGSDKVVVIVWDGFVIMEIRTLDKNSGPEAINLITELQNKWQIQNNCVAYDADGVGSYLQGYLKGALAINNNAQAIGKDRYANLKSQMGFEIAKKINNGEIYCKSNLHKNLIIEELEQLKRDKVDTETSLRLMPKAEVKKALGRSPDFSDAMIYRMIFELKPPIQAQRFNFI